MNELSTDALLDCDYCHKPMDAATYQTHACDGLRGRNPFQEKLRNARWTGADGKPVPQSVVDATLKARGTVVSKKKTFTENCLQWLRRG